MTDLTPAADHKVYPDGPPCTPDCPGAWSTYHDGYSWGYEKGQAEARASAEAAWECPECGHSVRGHLAATPAEPDEDPEDNLVRDGWSFPND